MHIARIDHLVLNVADHPTAGSDDLCFEAEATMAEVMDHLASCAVVIERGPGARAGAMTSVYCRDPDGNLIEIATYSL